MNASPQLRSNASTHLDAIRGAAALVVFLGHGRPLFLSSKLIGGGTPQTSVAPNPGALPRTTVGHEAVIVFFVLSGFFVGGSVMRNMRRNTFAWKPYLLQRLTRLWIVLIPALLLGLVVDHWGMHLWGALSGSLYTSPAGSLVFPGLAARLSLRTLLGNALFLQQSFVAPFGTNVALWSLACEFWYYIFFPLLLIALQSKFAFGRRLLSGLLFALVILGCGKAVAMYFPLWLAGCLVAVLPAQIPERMQRSATVLLGSLLLVTMACCLRLPIPSYTADFAMAFVFSLLLWAILHNQRTTLNSVYTFLARSMAKMSYTLYTVHVPLLIFGCALVSPVWHPQRLSSTLLKEVFVVYLGTFLIALAMYMLFERNTDVLRNLLEGRTMSARNKPFPPLTRSSPNLKPASSGPTEANGKLSS